MSFNLPQDEPIGSVKHDSNRSVAVKHDPNIFNRSYEDKGLQSRTTEIPALRS